MRYRRALLVLWGRFGSYPFTIADALPVLYPGQYGEAARQRAKADVLRLWRWGLLSRRKIRGRMTRGRPPYMYTVSRFGWKHTNFTRGMAGFGDFFLLTQHAEGVKDFCKRARTLLRRVVDTGYGGQDLAARAPSIEAMVGQYARTGDLPLRDYIVRTLASSLMLWDFRTTRGDKNPLERLARLQFYLRELHGPTNHLSGSSGPRANG